MNVVIDALRSIWDALVRTFQAAAPSELADLRISSIWAGVVDFLDQWLFVLILLGAVLALSRFLRSREDQDTAQAKPLGSGRFIDRPIGAPADDRLGFDPLAKRFASLLTGLPSGSESVVISLEGPWGSGKTSFINLVRWHASDATTDSQRFISFEPWLFSDETDLHQAFFEVLAEGFEASSDANQTIVDAIERYAAVLTAAPLPEPLAWALSAYRRLRHQEKSLSALREDLREKLLILRQPVVILIDDLDRLQAHQVNQMLQIVRAHANFPNLIFVLMLDRRAVAEQLDSLKFPGFDYLGKIIQVSISVPRADRDRLQALFDARIESEIDGWSEEPHEILQGWREAYRWGLSHLVRTPRDINQYFYGLEAQLPAVRPHIHLLDYLNLHALRTFEPRVHEGIFMRRQFLLRQTWSQATESEGRDEALDEQLSALTALARPENAEGVRYLLERLFPTSLSEVVFLEQRRLSSGSHFRVYFEHMIPEGLMALEELTDIVRMGQSQTYERLQQTWNGGAHELLSVFRAYRWHNPDLSEVDRVGLASALLLLMEEIARSQTPISEMELAFYGCRGVVQDVVGLSGQSPPLTHDQFERILSASAPIGVIMLRRQADLLPEGLRLDEETRHLLRRSLVTELRAFLSSPRSREYPRMAHRLGLMLLLTRGGSEEVRAEISSWFLNLIGDQSLFVDVMLGCLELQRSEGVVTYRLPDDTIIPRDDFVERIRLATARVELPPEIREALDRELDDRE